MLVQPILLYLSPRLKLLHQHSEVTPYRVVGMGMLCLDILEQPLAPHWNLTNIVRTANNWLEISSQDRIHQFLMKSVTADIPAKNRLVLTSGHCSGLALTEDINIINATMKNKWFDFMFATLWKKRRQD